MSGWGQGWGGGFVIHKYFKVSKFALDSTSRFQFVINVLKILTQPLGVPVRTVTKKTFTLGEPVENLGLLQFWLSCKRLCKQKNFRLAVETSLSQQSRTLKEGRKINIWTRFGGALERAFKIVLRCATQTLATSTSLKLEKFLTLSHRHSRSRMRKTLIFERIFFSCTKIHLDIQNFVLSGARENLCR